MDIRVSRRPWHAIALLLSLTGGCQAPPSSEAVARELDAALSSAAAVHLLLDRRLQNSVPAAYAERLIQAEHARLTQAAGRLRSLASAAPRRREALAATERVAVATGDARRIASDAALARRRMDEIGAVVVELERLRRAAGRGE